AVDHAEALAADLPDRIQRHGPSAHPGSRAPVEGAWGAHRERACHRTLERRFRHPAAVIPLALDAPDPLGPLCCPGRRLMLAPETRRILMEALEPPPGFRFDLAVATTYSLDLMALLTAPLAFSMFDADAARTRGDGDAAESTNPFALLQAVRSYAARTTVFCQAAQIVPPARYQRVLTYLEDSVVEVNPPSASGVFHPKLWALRMVGEDDEVLYRLLCLSRNLTFDRSWDTMLVL